MVGLNTLETAWTSRSRLVDGAETRWRGFHSPLTSKAPNTHHSICWSWQKHQASRLPYLKRWGRWGDWEPWCSSHDGQGFLFYPHRPEGRRPQRLRSRNEWIAPLRGSGSHPHKSCTELSGRLRWHTSSETGWAVHTCSQHL